MSELKLIVRTADQTRKAEISVTQNNKCAEILDAAISNWSLPLDTDYTIVNASTGKALIPSSTLENSGVSTGDILEIQPILVAGNGVS